MSDYPDVRINPYELIDEAASIFDLIAEKFGTNLEEVLGNDIAESIECFMIDADYWDDDEEDDADYWDDDEEDDADYWDDDEEDE